MPAGTTGGPLGTARAHYLYMTDLVLEAPLRIVNEILDGSCPDVLKGGVFAPIEKDDCRYRALTLLDVLFKCATGTFAR